MALDQREATVGVSALALLLVTMLTIEGSVKQNQAMYIFIGVLAANGAFVYVLSRRKK